MKRNFPRRAGRGERVKEACDKVFRRRKGRVGGERERERERERGTECVW